MPLIIMCGLPLSGKTFLSHKLNDILSEKLDSKPIVISDELKLEEYKRNLLYMNSKTERLLRNWLRSEVERYLIGDQLVILDSNNYIKGFRYELYCSSKERKTTHCLIEVKTSPEMSWNRNPSEDHYNKETFDALVARYEAPNASNRWDSPLFVIESADEIPFEANNGSSL